MSDMFGSGIRKTESQGIGRSEQTPEANYSQQAEAARRDELCAHEIEENQSCQESNDSDGIHFSEDAPEASSLNLANSLQAAWKSPAKPSGPPQLRVLQGPPPGLLGGFVLNSQGISNLEPGMQAGGIFSSP